MTKKLTKVKEKPELARVDESGVLVNLDQEGFHAFIAHREKLLEERNNMNELKEQIAELQRLVATLTKDSK